MTKAKYKYLIHLRKLKRNGYKDENYKLGRKILRYSHRKSYSFRNLDNGVYSIRYLIIIENDQKAEFSKWSGRNLREVK